MQTSPRSGTDRRSTRRRLRAGLRLVSAACALLAGSAFSAQAQYVFEDEILPPRAVVWRLSDRGFTGIARPRFDGRAYVVEAFDPRGDRVRLVVAPDSGAIVGRQRLEPPLIVGRLARPMPGYGWTEEDYGAARRPSRGEETGGLVPPGRIPMPDERGAYAARPLPSVPPRAHEPSRRDAAREASVADPAGNPLGLNPDAAGRQTAPRRSARPAPPGEKAASPRLSDVKPPEKPTARLSPEVPRPAEAPKPEAPRTETAKVDPAVDPKADAPKGPAMPAAQTPAPRTADLKPADKPADPGWKDPPEAKRNVRVIGGATIVPGTTDKDGATGN
ncbi:PepSY domain-containing protein [Methylobacterium radiodurans]|uniref:Uncharacterized protein n=1 Tax=Methylobacterium radiodurans TaxID=2202828 RepID=A0A2U8VZ39_9HYPH|nr:PepSY domain-containing protein [Methylobacterium radiodurans]AWN38621.1 hypothetical protein DK427_25220 [Methylobacterium radiodurans]